MAWQITFGTDCASPPVDFIDPPEGMPLFGLSVSVPLNPSLIPIRGRISEAWNRSIPDIFMTPGMNGVSQTFRALVEQHEPNLHQFFPLDLIRCDGTPVEETFFIFNCAVGVDAVLFTRAPARWVENALGVPFVRAGMSARFELSRPAILGRHLWCGDRIGSNSLFVSNEFLAAMERANITNFYAKRREEIDEAWVAEDNIQPLLDWEAEHCNRS